MRSAIVVTVAIVLVLLLGCGAAQAPTRGALPLADNNNLPIITFTPSSMPTEAPVPEPTMRAEATRQARITPQPRPTVVVEEVANAPAVVQFVNALRKRGIEPRLADVSRLEFLRAAPGQVYDLGDGSLHVHLYPNVAAAGADAAKIPRLLENPLLDWFAPPHFFQCQALIVTYFGQDKRIMMALAKLCGPQFAGEPAVRAPQPTEVSLTSAALRSYV